MVSPLVAELGVPLGAALESRWEDQLPEGYSEEPDEGEEAGATDNKVSVAQNICNLLGMQEAVAPI